MHGALTILGVLALIGFAFGERAARAAAVILLSGAGCVILFVAYVFFCALRH